MKITNKEVFAFYKECTKDLSKVMPQHVKIKETVTKLISQYDIVCDPEYLRKKLNYLLLKKPRHTTESWDVVIFL